MEERAGARRIAGRLCEHLRANVVGYLALFVALSGTAWAAATIGTNDIQNRAVTAKKLHSHAVTKAKIENGAVTSSKVLDGSLAGSDLAPNTIAGANILDESIGSADLGSGSVDTAEIATGAVSPEKVGTIPTVRARRTTGQTIQSGSFTPINLTAETWDTASMHSTSSNTSRLRAPISGTYLITANVSWTSNNTGQRALEITLDTFTESNKPIAAIAQSADLSDAPMALSTVYQLGTGEIVRAQVLQDSGVAQILAASGSGDETSPEVSMTWLGPE